MPRIDLEVPFAEKDEAKRLGARWDAANKVWYVPDRIDPLLFKRWFPQEPECNFRASSYFIAQSAKSCWKCGAPTRVFGFLLPAGHKTLEGIECEESDGMVLEWVTVGTPTILHYVDCIPQSVQMRISVLSRNYRLDFSKTTQSSYWMNHCDHCAMKQGDFEMHCEPQGAFFPMDERDAARISLHFVSEPFEAGCGGYSCDVDFFRYMRKA